MTTEFDKDKVMSRVRKMLALANDSAATEGERDNALRMAHATLAKYNLTLGEATLVEEDRGAGQQMMRSDAPWMRTVANAVAQLFFCEFFYSKMRRDGGIQYSFVGKEANSMTAASMTMYVISSILKETRKRAREPENIGRPGFARSFAKGAAVQVHLRCREIRKAAEAASAAPSSGTSLVLASVYQTEQEANRAWLAKSVPNLRTERAKTRMSRDLGAFDAGRQYGDRIGLQQQIGGTTKPNPSLE